MFYGRGNTCRRQRLAHRPAKYCVKVTAFHSSASPHRAQFFRWPTVSNIFFTPGLPPVSLSSAAQRGPELRWNLVLVNESDCRQLGKWSRCLILSFSSPQWIGWLWDIRDNLTPWSKGGFYMFLGVFFTPALIRGVKSELKSAAKSSLSRNCSIHRHTWTPWLGACWTTGKKWKCDSN